MQLLQEQTDVHRGVGKERRILYILSLLGLNEEGKKKQPPAPVFPDCSKGHLFVDVWVCAVCVEGWGVGLRWIMVRLWLGKVSMCM